MFPKFGIAKVAVSEVKCCKLVSDSFVYLYDNKMFVPLYEVAISSVKERLWRGYKFSI